LEIVKDIRISCQWEKEKGPLYFKARGLVNPIKADKHIAVFKAWLVHLSEGEEGFGGLSGWELLFVEDGEIFAIFLLEEAVLYSFLEFLKGQCPQDVGGQEILGRGI